MNEAIWGFTGTLVGAFVSIVATYLTNKNNLRVQKEVEIFKQHERARQFQFETLLNLQTKLTEGARLVMKANIELIEHFRNDESYETSSKLAEEIRLSFQTLNILIERIDNTILREELNNFSNEMYKCLFPSTIEDANSFQLRLIATLNKMLPLIGEHLRGVQSVQ